ncbi:MAG: hypothetical protein AB7F74_16345 [Parvibaculaceae bacterium]
MAKNVTGASSDMIICPAENFLRCEISLSRESCSSLIAPHTAWLRTAQCWQRSVGATLSTPCKAFVVATANSLCHKAKLPRIAPTALIQIKIRKDA